MIIPFPPKAAPAPRPNEPQGWPPGLRPLVEHLARIGMPCYPIA
jgi:hypothetical protein